MGWVIGVDEVGRGSLSGPVLTAGVRVLRPTNGTYPVPGVTDSKKLTPAVRERLAKSITQTAVVAIEQRSADFIDQKGISRAVGECFRACIEKLLADTGSVKVDAVLVDGNPLWTPKFLTGRDDVPVYFIPKGDQKEWSIGAASIVAKVTRDKLVVKSAAQYPGYGWDRNMGYGTAEHSEAIKKLGFTPQHRRTFCKDILDDTASVFEMFGDYTP